MAGYSGPMERLASYERVLEVVGLERKGATMPYTSLNGYMTSFLDKVGGVGLRLGPDDRAAFLDAFDTTLAEQYGRVMVEFVVVPDDLLDRSDDASGWFVRGIEWVASRPPKPTTR